MLTRIIARSAGFRGLALTTDDELDAALALCGEIDLPARTRYCLQTTYLNECYPEYRGLGPGQRLVWVVRNPYSVVYSMVYNWRRFALNELFVACGQASAPDGRMRRIDLPWPVGPSAIERACLSYSGKTRQIEEILQFLPPDRVMVVDYDALVLEPRAWLEQIFAFVGEPYDESYARAVQPDSARKAERLSANAAALVAEVAEPTYRSCLRLCTRPRSP